MNSAIALIPAILAALAAAVCGLCFALSFAAWIEVPAELRRGPTRPRPFLLLAFFTILASTSYLLIP